MNNKLTRRDFLRVSAAGIGSVVLSVGLVGCNSDSTSPTGLENTIGADFKHGVASGDPLSDRVILWTRVSPEKDGDIRVSWEVATDADFKDLIRTGSTITTADRDYTVKVDAIGLDAASDYYYRFIVGNKISPVARTRTLPESAVEQAKFVVVSCANYFTGYYNAYKEAAKIEDIDAVLHLGDYIYEYGNDHMFAKEWAGKFPSDDQRQVEPERDCQSLSDYRTRYAQHRRDRDLQSLHHKVPFITVWDDHELANDTYNDGAEGHDDEKHGEWAPRRLAALQTYFEWMPIRPFALNDDLTINRQFKYGELVDLIMLDTRVVGRELPIDMMNYLNFSDMSLDIDSFLMALDQDRTMLGQKQFKWLDTKLAGSAATWQLLGQQVPMAKLDMPKNAYLQMFSGMFNPNASVGVPAILDEMIMIKDRIDAGDDTVTAEEHAKLVTVPFRSTAWDGYSYERERLFELTKQYGSNLIVLAADTHNCWASRLTDNEGQAVGVEFAIGSVTSPGADRYYSLTSDLAREIEPKLSCLASDIEYCNLFERGFMVLTFTPDEATAEYLFVNTVTDRNYQLDAGLTRKFKVTAENPTKLLEV